MKARTVQLGELGDIVSGSTPKTGVLEFWNGDIPWVTPADLSNHEGIFFQGTPKRITDAGFRSCSASMLPPGSILFSSRAPIGHSAVTTYPICTNQGFKSIIPNKNLDSVYGYFVLKFLTPGIIAKGRGATFAEVTKEIMEEVQVPLPSLPEQRRIAARLEEADRLRRTRRYALELSDTFLPAAFLEMFGEPAAGHEHWPIEELGEHLDAIEGGVNFQPVSENEPASEWRVLKVSAVSWGDFKPEESKAISPAVQFAEHLIVKHGDVIMSRANTAELVGAVARVRMPPGPVLLPDKLWRLKFAPASEILPDYTLFALRSRGIRKEIEVRASGTSGSMKNISKDDAAALRIPVPPLPLQQRFAEVVRGHERLRATQREALRQAEHLFQSLLHEAFAERA